MSKVDFLFSLVPSFLWILFFRFAVKEGNIFGFFSMIDKAVQGLEEEPPAIYTYLKKPFWGCTVCMASVHGTACLILQDKASLIHVDNHTSVWVLHCVCVSGLMIVYHGAFEKKSLW